MQSQKWDCVVAFDRSDLNNKTSFWESFFKTACQKEVFYVGNVNIIIVRNSNERTGCV